MAKASRHRPTLASATHAIGSTPRVDIGQALREAADPTPALAPYKLSEQRPSAPSRTGKRGVVGYVDPALWAQLRHLAIDERSSIQALVLEGLDRVLKARGLAPKANE